MEDCFAKSLSGCSGKISREHFISESVLLLIADKDQKIHINGFPWIPSGEKRHIPTATLKSKILCTHHNRLLSNLDGEAGKFFSFLRPSSQPKNEKISGKKIEKWMMKCMLGMQATGILKSKESDSEVKIEEQFLEYLFNDKEFAEPFGLVFELEPSNSKMEFRIEFHANEELKMITSLHILAFGISLKFNFLEIAMNKLLAGSQNRPPPGTSK